MIPTKSPHPLRLTSLRRRLEGWRRTRAHPRSPIPKALWAGAVAVARAHGLYHTCRALRLDYGTLKRHVEAADASGRAHPTPAFVEYAGSTLSDLGACAIEFTGPRGTVRIRVPGLALADLATLSRTLVGADA